MVMVAVALKPQGSSSYTTMVLTTISVILVLVIEVVVVIQPRVKDYVCLSNVIR